MRAGRLRDSVRVERRTETSTDAWGNPAPGTWATLIAAQPASLIPQGGDERVRADRLTGAVRYEIVVRWSAANAAIRDGDKFVLARASAGLASGAELNIRHAGVAPTEKRTELRFMAEAGVAV
jgi:hypothetical protein